MRSVLVYTALVASMLFFISPRIASAQIVNVLNSVESSEEGFNGAIEFPLEWRTGNTNLIRIGGTLLASYRKGNHLAFFQFKADYGAKKDDKNYNYDDPYISNTFEHLRYRFHLKGPWSAEAFIQHAANEKTRLKLRALAGGGLRFQSADAKWGYVALGTDYMASYEKYNEEKDCYVDPGLEHRWSNYVQLVLALDEIISLQQTTFAQPRFDDFADIRLLTEAGLVVKPGKLYIKISMVIAYDSRLADKCEGLEPLDTTLKNAIGFTF